ncbi:MAG: hypothetical protein R3C49_20860 [Planctomycetaceae bacterium]
MADFNLSAEVRKILEKNSELSGNEVLAQLRRKFPKEQINEGTAKVAFSLARRKLGLISLKPRKKGKAAVSAAAAPSAKPVASGNSAGIDSVIAAKDFLQACNGDMQVAMTAIKQLGDLQLR